jgi:hypothetical protein
MTEADHNTLTAQQQIETLWQEYRYRHDLVWRILATAAVFVTTLAIVPYSSTEVTTTLGCWILFAPAGSVLAVLIASRVLHREVILMEYVRQEYTSRRDWYLGLAGAQNLGNPGFRQSVRLLLAIGIAVSLGNGLLIFFVWLPSIGVCCP